MLLVMMFRTYAVDHKNFRLLKIAQKQQFGIYQYNICFKCQLVFGNVKIFIWWENMELTGLLINFGLLCIFFCVGTVLPTD